MLSSIFLVVALAAMLPAILMAPHTAIFIWSWISYMNPHRNTWSFAKTLPILDAVAAFTFVAWLTSKERKLPPAHPICFIMLAFFLWTSITTLFANLGEMASSKLIIFSKIILFTFFTMIFITTKDRIKYLIYTILIGLSLYSLRGGIFTILNGGQYIVFGPPNTFLSDNNQLALAFLTVVPFYYWVYKYGEHRLIRLAAVGAGALTLISVLGSHSRGALIALAGMAGWMFVVSRKMVLGIVVSVTLVGGAAILMPDKWVERMESIGEYEEDQSANTRLRMWRYSMNVANASPVIGGGFSFFFDQSLAKQHMPGGGKIFVAHSIYFDTLGEHGYVGLFLYFLLFSAAFVTTVEIRKLAKGHDEFEWARDLAQMLQLALVGFALGGSFLSLSIFDLYYHVVALCMMVHFVVAKELAPEQGTFSLSSLGRRTPDEAAVPAQ